jgi:molybdate transport system ATP-binding protein
MNLDVDISLTQGSFSLDAKFHCVESALGIFGPSGCGKTTLFRAIAGLVRPDRGHINLENEPLVDTDIRAWIPPYKRNIGLVFQDARLFPHWSVEENLRAGKTDRKNHPYSFDDVVDLLDIGQLIGRSVEDLSGGERQRIAMGRTLLTYPRLLLMDEPVAGLDPSLKMQILPFLAKVHQELNMPTVFISHDLGEILQLTDHILLMRDGRVKGLGTLEKLASNPVTLKELKGADLTNVLSLRIDSHDDDRGVTVLELPGDPNQHLQMELAEDLAIGSSINVGIPANQIALARESIEHISMRNQLHGNVEAIVHAGERSICHIDTAAGRIIAEITPGTEAEMLLVSGTPIWVLFKSFAVHRL